MKFEYICRIDYSIIVNGFSFYGIHYWIINLNRVDSKNLQKQMYCAKMYIAAGKYLKSSFGLHGIWWPKKIMILKQGRDVSFTTDTVLKLDFHISRSLLCLSCILVSIGKRYSLLLNYKGLIFALFRTIIYVYWIFVNNVLIYSN